MHELEASASGKMDELMPAINRLVEGGISRQLHTDDKDSQTVVTYPPSSRASEMDEADVYGNPDDLLGRNTLYIHVPFCDGICSYCSYSRTAIGQDDPRIDFYLDALGTEISLLRRAVGNVLVPAETVYIGGGTPTLLSEKGLNRLLGLVQDNFALAPDAEYTLEASPETITEGKIRVAVRYGVNRVSVGAESFDDDILRRMKRRHLSEDTLRALDIVRAEGIENLDIDLIRGYVGQGIREMLVDVQAVGQANVPSVTSYQFGVKPGSLDHKRLHGLQPDQLNQIYLHLLFLEGMKNQGRIQHPVDWFPIDEHHVYRHQVLKWRDAATQLAFGPSSYGYVGGVQFFNHEGGKYNSSLSSGKLPVAKGVRLSSEEKIRRDIIFGLKTGIDREKFQERHGYDPTQTVIAPTLASLKDAGGISVTEQEISLTEAGKLFADKIQRCFYS